MVEPLQTSLLIGSLEGSALRARPDFRLTRGSRLRAASIRAAAKPISGQNHLAGEPVLSSQSWRPGLGTAARAGEPPHPAVLRGAGRANIWELLGHHPWLRPKVLPLSIRDACQEVVKLGPQDPADVGLRSGRAIRQDAVRCEMCYYLPSLSSAQWGGFGVAPTCSEIK